MAAPTSMPSPAARRWRRFWSNRSSLVGTVLILLVVGTAGLGPLVTGDPGEASGSPLASPLSTNAETGETYWLGTDILSRSMTARLVHGARTTLLIGCAAVVLALLVGVPLGILSGYAGGAIDFTIMRITEVALSLPAILLAIVIVTIVGPGQLSSVVVAVALVAVPPYVRQLRATAIATREREYVLASRALGAGHLHILRTAILPSCTGPITVLATLGIGTAILDAAGLNFLGLGPEPDTPEWGLMLGEARSTIIRGTDAWWATVLPGLAILGTVLGFNLVGDALRDALDDRAR